MEIRPSLPEQDPNIPPPPPAENAAGMTRLPFSWWWLVSALAFGLVFGIGGLELFRMLARPLGILILAITVAAALAPVVEWLSARIPHALAVILVYLVLLLIIFGILGSTVPLLIAQVRGLTQSAQTWLPRITDWLGQFGIDPAGIRSTLLSEAGSMGALFFRLPFALSSTLFEFVLVIFMSLYWLFLMPNIKQFFLSFFPAEQKGFVGHVIARMGTEIGGYLRGAAINGLIIGTLKYLGMLVIGVPYALTLGSIAALMEFFPTIGPIISGAIATLVGLSVSPRIGIIVLIYAIVLQQLEGHILLPLIMRSQTEISPLLAIFSVVAGAAIGGLLGAVIGIPIASVLSVLIRQVIGPAIRRANGVGAEEV